jgi:diguanylate cyclase (GGDEF)-like protein/PAS domain S-box-containing protein
VQSEITYLDRLETSQSLFHSIVQHATDGIVVVDFDGYVIHSNPAAAALFQARYEDFHGQMFGFPIVANQSAEIDIVRPGGAMAIAEMRVSEALWEGKRVLIAMLRDITERKQMEHDLRKAKEELAALYRSAPVGVIALRSDWRVTLWNPAAEHIFGWRADEVAGSVFPDLDHLLNLDLDEMVSRGEAVSGKELRYVRRDGTEVDVSLSLAPMHDEAGQAAGIMCIVEDISRRMRDARNLLLSSKIFANTQEGILVTDADGTIRSVNQAFVSLTGYQEEEAIGRKPSLLNSGRHDQAFYAEMWQALIEHGQWRGEIWNRRKNGEIYPEWINISAIHDDAGNVSHFVAIFSDITKVKQNEERLRHLAHFDALTGLPNRFLFHDHVELALARAARNNKQLAIMFLDLDRFKLINDTLGHRAGDTLLTEVGQRLAGCLRSSDTLSRFGGDEFTVVLPDLDSGGAAATVAEKFIDALSADFHIAGKKFHITVSIGIAIYPQDGEHLDTLSRAADAAMFAAKDHGRNTYRFHAIDGRDTATTRRFHLESQLRRALEREEMAVVYQPEVDVRSGVITGMEALLRWNTPEFGEILPEEFIPLAEDIGIISVLGHWVLREACRQNKAWQDEGMPPICVSVNLSPVQLRDRRLLEDIRQVLAETGLEGRWLELELTEGMLMQNIEESLLTFDALKQLGVRLSIDDFGSGYSSLGYLRRLPVDTLKIDPSFVAHIASSPEDAVISRVIVDLAHNLNLRVVAEGVESAAQLETLREFQRCYAQGFYFSPPLPAVQITSQLGNRESHTWRNLNSHPHQRDLSG